MMAAPSSAIHSSPTVLWNCPECFVLSYYINFSQSFFFVISGFSIMFICFLGPLLNESLLSFHFHDLRLSHWFHHEQKEIKPSRSPSFALPILLIQMQISWTVKMPWQRRTHTRICSQPGGPAVAPPSQPNSQPSGEAARNIIAINQGRSPQGNLLFNYQAAFL